MAGPTRIKTRSSGGNAPPISPNGDAPTGIPPPADGNAEPVQSNSHDSASRLSEGLEPIHLGDAASLNEQLHDAASELNRLGFHVKDVISTIQRLEGLGLQQHNIPLPKIIVLGEQSTGKSSVIESISGIKTPRDIGTCTRCPLFIKLEPLSDPHGRWSARVTLRRNFGFDGKTGRGSERRFPGWYLLPQPKVETFTSTNNPDQLEEIITRAQTALTTPWTDYKEFLLPTYHHTKEDQQSRFSPNVVCISINHPDLPALSFYDLPGIIGQSDNPSDVKFVRDLVIEYVKDPEALVLVTCAMDNDIANSAAGGIARQLKASDRCIGVLTKPDRITVTAREEKVHEIFIEKRLPFGHGYFVVRNRDHLQLKGGLSHQDARFQEKQFFEQEEPWATQCRNLQSRFGTLKLQAFLSGKLAEQITKRLPVIQKEIDIRLEQVEDQLKQFPEPPTQNASRIIYDVVYEFAQNVRKELVAEYPRIDWRNNWEALQRALFDALLSLKPTLAASGKRDRGIYAASLVSLASGHSSGRSVNDAIALPESEDEADTDGDVSMSGTPNPETPSKKRKMDNTPAPSPLKAPRTPSKSPDFSDKRTKYQLDALAEHLERKSKSKIPGLIEPRVINDEMVATLKHWELPLDDFFGTLEKQLEIQLKGAFHESFVKWEGTALYSEAWKIAMEMLNLNLHQQRTTMAKESLDDENEGPYIFHSDIFNREMDAVLQLYRQARFKARMAIYKKERLHRTGKAMTAAEENKMQKDEKFIAVINSEPYSVELNVAARVTTYYMLAARRFHDSICMRIESKFFKQLRTQLRDELENGLGIHDEVEGHCNAVRLLAEQSQREKQRQELLAQRNALQQGQQILVDLEKKKYDEDTASPTSRAGSANSGSSSSFGLPPLQSEEMEEEM
ncbi:hypothetical protein CC86DRAFT_41688 [Ophiobolus disseminans]|uniref:P-loop containing nucleoside triphosphate hydrolase protein n=1 Tax=Ophiobolus disseminans TaxID=1469910 RepID=A0A6A6ZXS3_9PLEO|nr:hypothetical protein CC86DRAFT_41688 [Ophiobolus disseminans]